MEPGQRVGELLIDSVAGVGGMGTVYRATVVATGRAVALKVIHTLTESACRRFLREVALVAGIRHPSIVEHVAHGVTDDGRPYLVMEWLDGIDLAAMLARRRLTVREAVGVVARTARALGALHEQGIVHRDVKPANIFCVGGDVRAIKLLDLGIARHVRGTDRFTQTGAILGTPGFLAPEQARGEREIDGRVDVFALGCVLYECLSGEPAFRGSSAINVLASLLLSGAPRLSDRIPEVAPQLDALVARMLSQDPVGRPRDGFEVARLLDELGALADTAAGVRPADRTTLGSAEQRFVVVIERGISATRGRTGDAADGTVDGASQDALRRVVELHGGVLASPPSLDRIVVAGGPVTESHLRAARCALALRALEPGVAVFLGAVRAHDAGAPTLGSLEQTFVEPPDPTQGVALSPTSAALLSHRFEVVEEGGLHLLIGEKRVGAEPPQVLGKRTPLTGRLRERSVIRAAFDECVQESLAAVVLVTGETGVGKTRLCLDVVDELERAGTTVWRASGDPLAASVPYRLLVQALAGAAGFVSGEPVELQRRRVERWLASLTGNLGAERLRFHAAVLGELLGVPFDPPSPTILAARRDPALMTHRLRETASEIVRSFTARSPLVLWLDDLHWADQGSLSLLDSALRETADHPWLVIGSGSADLDRAIPGLFARRRRQDVRVGGVSARAAAELVRYVLGAATDRGVVDRIVERAGGNPFFLEELMRAVAVGSAAELPMSALAVLEARVADLPASLRRLLRAASIFGVRFWESGVIAMLDDPSDSLAVAGGIDELVRRELVTAEPTSRFVGEAEHRFTQAAVREVVYGMLTEDDARVGHHVAAAWLRGVGEADAIVAEHHERAGELHAAAAAHERAARGALAAGQLEAAARFVARGRRCGAEGETLGLLGAVGTVVHKWTGELDVAAEHARLALALLPVGGETWWSTLGDAALIAGMRGDAARALELRSLVLAESRPGAGAASWIGAAARVGWALLANGELDLASEVIDYATQASSGSDPPLVAARLYAARAARAMASGRAGEALPLRRLCLERFEEAGDAREACNQRVNVADVLRELGALEPASDLLARTLVDARALELEVVIAIARCVRADVWRKLGHLDGARDDARAAVEHFAASRNARMEATAHVYGAEIDLDRGALDDAEAHARRAAFELQPPAAVCAQALGVLSRIALARGAPHEALRHAEAGMRIVADQGSLDEGEIELRLAHVDALEALGEHERARQLVCTAAEHLRERAARVPDEGLRESFLELPAHRRTFDLAERARSSRDAPISS